MSARYYIYRNLHTGNFSIKYRGKVIDHQEIIMLYEVEFRVSERGRQRVLREKRKNVHATAAAKTWNYASEHNLDNWDEIYYNPYKTRTFVDKDGMPIYRSDKILCQNNKIYIPKLKG